MSSAATDGRNIGESMLRIFRQPRRQLALTAVILLCAVIAFGLFFADAVTDPGGDGIQAYKIAFRVIKGDMHFNAAAFIAYLLPLIAAALSVIPYPDNRWNLLPAVIFAAAGIMIEFMFQIYQMPFSEEIRQLHVDTGEGLADGAIIAGWLCFAATACCLFKSFYKDERKSGEGKAICAPCGDANEDVAIGGDNESASIQAAESEVNDGEVVDVLSNDNNMSAQTQVMEDAVTGGEFGNEISDGDCDGERSQTAESTVNDIYVNDVYGNVDDSVSVNGNKDEQLRDAESVSSDGNGDSAQG